MSKQILVIIYILITFFYDVVHFYIARKEQYVAFYYLMYANLLLVKQRYANLYIFPAFICTGSDNYKREFNYRAMF